jgi:SagB-type dehydrogenase family enzyme
MKKKMKKISTQKIDFGLANAAVYANSSKEMAPWVESTGLRTNELRYRSLSHSKDIRIAEDFLINTRLVRHYRESETSIESYFNDSAVVMLSMLGHEENIGLRELSLPESARLRMELAEVIGRRRSIRNYTGDEMELDYLATILRSAAGITAYAEVNLQQGDQATLRFRTTPSGGGLYPVDLYVAVLNVKDLDRGIYRYDPINDTILQLGDRSDIDKLLQCFAVPEQMISISRANAIFLLVGQPWRAMRKYGNRGMRFLFIEAGSMAEHINMATLALGFGSLDCASIYDDEAHEAMHLDGLYQSLLHTVIVGYPG